MYCAKKDTFEDLVGWRKSGPRRCFFMVDKTTYIQRIKNIYTRKTGKVLSDVEALDVFENLVTLVSAVYQPIQKEFFQDVHKNYQLIKKDENKK
jgi:hypothetical protein